MKEKTKLLIDLLENGMTCNEICIKLGMSNKQLYTYLTDLKNKGLFYNRKYYTTGDITYKPLTLESSLSNDKGEAIISANTQNNLTCLAISDLHFGNALARIDLLNKVFDYCKEHDIHIIFLCGDLVDGNFTNGVQKIANYYEQLDYFSKNYPHDKNILTFAVLGDHDHSGLRLFHQSFLELLKNYRHDIIVSDYGNSIVNIKNDTIHLYHHIDNISMIKSPASIILHGHSHKYMVEQRDNRLNINVPSLSDINDSLPTILEINLSFKSGFINDVIIKQLYLENKVIILSEVNYNLLKGKVLTIGKIKNVE